MAFAPIVPPIQVHLCVKGGAEAIAFYKKAFGATVSFSKLANDGVRYMHANLQMFGGEVMLHDDFPDYEGDVCANDGRAPAIAININLPRPADVDAAIGRAAAAGATVTTKPDDMFWGARYGRIRDPFGHVWAFNAPVAART